MSCSRHTHWWLSVMNNSHNCERGRIRTCVVAGSRLQRGDKYRFLEKEHTVEPVSSLFLSIFLCHFLSDWVCVCVCVCVCVLKAESLKLWTRLAQTAVSSYVSSGSRMEATASFGSHFPFLSLSLCLSLSLSLSLSLPLCSIFAILSRLGLTINILYGTVHVGKMYF